MFQDRSNKPRTQILDLVDDSSELSVLSQSDLKLVNGGKTFVYWTEACSCAVGGGEDYDTTLTVYDD